MLRRVLIVLAVALGLALLLPAAIVTYYSLGSPRTEPIAGNNSISELLSVPLGGASQSILIRGADRGAPVLLYLHAGPGMAAMAVSDLFSRELEKHFVVVQWDQRSSGKSCHAKGLREGGFTEILASDAADLIAYLQGRLGTKPVYLVGHGTGAVVGAVVAQRRPELVAGLVMVAPLVDTVRNEQKVLDWVRARATENGDSEVQATLAGLSIPYASKEDFQRVQDQMAEYGGESTNPKGILPVFARMLTAPEYSLHDKLLYIECLQDSVAAGWESVWKIRLSETVPALRTPVWFFLGGKDNAVAADVVREYYELLDAPTKEMVMLPDAAHYPMFEQPEAFDRELIARLLQPR